jgi:hypothetical protein
MERSGFGFLKDTIFSQRPTVHGTSGRLRQFVEQAAFYF